MGTGKILLIVYSYHHKSTEKIADVMARALQAEVTHPGDVDSGEVAQYDLVGFGAGIDSGKHYRPILDFADTLPTVDKKKAFLFSTSGVTGKGKMAGDHAVLRKKLVAKGYYVVEEFQCKGFNTNSFLKYFGGMNKGRPNAEDLKNAEDFAHKLKEYLP